MTISADQLRNILEASMLVAARPLSLPQLEALFEDDVEPPTRDELREAITALQAEYEGRGIELVEVASGYRLQSRQEMSPWVANLFQEKAPRYSRALLETLVLVAYRQPITRGEVEDVRGVAVSTNIIKTLLERKWIKAVGHRDVPGRPTLYATTREFLDYFNLKKIGDLPTLSEIKSLDEIDPELAAEVSMIDEQNEGEGSQGEDGSEDNDSGEQGGAVSGADAGDASNNADDEEPDGDGSDMEARAASPSDDNVGDEAAGGSDDNADVSGASDVDIGPDAESVVDSVAEPAKDSGSDDDEASLSGESDSASVDAAKDSDVIDSADADASGESIAAAEVVAAELDSAVVETSEVADVDGVGEQPSDDSNGIDAEVKEADASELDSAALESAEDGAVDGDLVDDAIAVVGADSEGAVSDVAEADIDATAENDDDASQAMAATDDESQVEKDAAESLGNPDASSEVASEVDASSDQSLDDTADTGFLSGADQPSSNNGNGHSDNSQLRADSATDVSGENGASFPGGSDDGERRTLTAASRFHRVDLQLEEAAPVASDEIEAAMAEGTAAADTSEDDLPELADATIDAMSQVHPPNGETLH